GSFCFTIARTRHFDERLLTAVRSGLTQLVLLGAAYDSSPIRFRKELQGCASLRSIFPACRRARSSSRFISVDFTRQCFQAALAEHPCAEGFLPAGGRLLLPAAVGGGERVDFIGSRCARQLDRLRLRHPRLRRGDTSTYGGKQVARWL